MELGGPTTNQFPSGILLPLLPPYMSINRERMIFLTPPIHPPLGIHSSLMEIKGLTLKLSESMISVINNIILFYRVGFKGCSGWV